jgi:hypothetical protein
MAGGRPTKYDPSLIVEVERYLETTGREQTKLPTMEGYALWIGVHTDTLNEWEKHYPEFSASLRKISQRQKEQLVNDGIYGGKEVNATIVKLLLQNNHGMREKQELTGNDGGPLNINLYTGTGFTPPPETSIVGGLIQVQGVSVAQESTEDIDGTQ